MENNYRIPPRIVAVHDLSYFGRCALTVVIPTLSVMGYQVVPLPTAFLSTHTGGFDDLHFRDLTDDMHKTAAHFSRLGLSFDSIYTGFLGSEAQIDFVEDFFEAFAKEDAKGSRPLILVDPVMGDDGVLYSTYTKELMLGMKRLSRHASVLTPNWTEACFLTDTPFCELSALPPCEALARAADVLTRREQDFGCDRIVITGIFLSDGRLANLGRDMDGTRFCVERPLLAHSYPGTGDIFASVLLGELLDGKSFEASCAAAADFITLLITTSSSLPTPVREGVALEGELWRLCSPSKGNSDLTRKEERI